MGRSNRRAFNQRGIEARGGAEGPPKMTPAQKRERRRKRKK